MRQASLTALFMPEHQWSIQQRLRLFGRAGCDWGLFCFRGDSTAWLWPELLQPHEDRNFRQSIFGGVWEVEWGSAARDFCTSPHQNLIRMRDAIAEG